MSWSAQKASILQLGAQAENSGRYDFHSLLEN